MQISRTAQTVKNGDSKDRSPETVPGCIHNTGFLGSPRKAKDLLKKATSFLNETLFSFTAQAVH